MADAYISYSSLFILLSFPILLTYVYVYFLLFPSFFLPFLLNAHLLADHARTGKPGHPAPSSRSSQKIDHCTYRATPPTDHATQYPGINTK
jgi:hypothetical protein